jgi:hypothetical protein
MRLKQDVDETPYFHRQRQAQSFSFPALLLPGSLHCD